MSIPTLFWSKIQLLIVIYELKHDNHIPIGYNMF